MFNDKYPAAWIFHKNSCQPGYNSYLPEFKNGTLGTYKEYLESPTIALPGISVPDTDFVDLLLRRHSCREYDDRPVSIQGLANVLFAGYGMKSLSTVNNYEFMKRTVPSGGGLYPLELYLIARSVEGLQAGIYHYGIRPAMLEQLRTIEITKSYLYHLFNQQPYVALSGAVIIATSVIERNMKKYGDRGYRYILYEAGHSFQNMNLMAEASGLSSVNLGGFIDTEIASLLGIDMEEEIPLYAMALGQPLSEENVK